MAKEKQDKIKIDKDFLDLILKKITDLERKFEFIEKSPIPSNKVIEKDKGHFWCVEIRIKPIRSQTDLLENQEEIKELHKELEGLMRKYQVINLNAFIFSSLEK